MKKIINGKRYDTDTAEFIGYEQYLYPGQLDWWREELYKKKTGEFFLYGEGGPRSQYGVWRGNSASGGKEIRPLTLQDAQEWGERYLDADRYEEVFGRIEEGKVQISTWVSDGVKEQADVLREKGHTLADIFEAGVKALI